MVRDSANTVDLWPQTTKTSMVSPNKVHTLTLKISKMVVYLILIILVMVNLC